MVNIRVLYLPQPGVISESLKSNGGMPPDPLAS